MSLVNQAINDLIVLRDDDNQALTGLTADDLDVLEAYLIAIPATTAAVTLTEIGGGEYRASFTPTVAGAWALHYVYGAGSLFDFLEGERRYEVESATGATYVSVGIGDAYATLDQLKARLNITTTDANRDAAMTSALLAASRQIDGWTGRRFGQSGTATAKVLSPYLYDVLAIPDAVSVTEIANDISLNRTYGDVWLDTDFDLYPFDAADRGEPYTEIRLTPRGRRVFIYGPKSVRVTGVWGWPAVPPSVQEATLIQAMRLWKRSEAPLGLAGSQEFQSPIANVDPDVKALIAQYKVRAA